MKFIDPLLLEYCEAHSSAETEVLKTVSRQTHLTQINPRMLSGHLQGRFLKMITQLISPKSVLEIGTYTGYSAICMAEAMAERTTIHTIELNEELEPLILANTKKAGCSDKVNLHIGNALKIIPQLLETITFDMVFIDADKENYPAYFELLRYKLKPGATIIADNVLWSGKVLDETERLADPETMAIHEFNEMLAADTSFEKVILPIRDGITIARKIS